ncbi:hypothetical protein YC2023_102796 [Brassica napus]
MVICLLRFAKIGQYRGEVQISNAYNASQMFVNPEIPEAGEFKQRLPVHIGEERVCGVLLRSLNRHRSEKTFNKQTMREVTTYHCCAKRQNITTQVLPNQEKE